MNALKKLEHLGQSVWLDFIDRNLIRSGELKRFVDEDGVTGVTSNPSIFEKAITETHEYEPAIDKLLASNDRDVLSIYEQLAIKDIQDTADILLPTYQRLNGRDGFISLEVSPYLAYDTDATTREARRLWKAVDRPNVMIKVPATTQGIPAIRQLTEDGINVNITLLFSVAVYEQVAQAFLEGLEARQARGEKLTPIASVASFFVSRIDTVIDKQLEERIHTTSKPAKRSKLINLLGKIAIANAKLAYDLYQKIYSSSRWEQLARDGARPQRLLWASTGTKNPKYRDVMYIESLIGRDTVNTVPLPTLLAFKEHGHAIETLTQGLDEAQKTLKTLREEGFDLDAVTKHLVIEGVEKFCDPFDKLLASLQRKREAKLGTWLNRFTYQVPSELQTEINLTLNEWRKSGKLRAEWRHDSSVWTHSGEERWLGWLDVPKQELRLADELQSFTDEVRSEGYRHVVLLGMGGSSLGAEVLAKTFGETGLKGGYLEFHVLDSTDPAQIQELERNISIKHSLFIVSSKSGSTLEPNIFYDYFSARVKELVGDAKAGEHFIAITDPETSLEKKAREAQFRKIFFGVPSIGGRYSVLSNFGMVPAALIGVDVRKFLNQTLPMVWSSFPDAPPTVNLGVLLGVILGTTAKHGRDKITFFCSKEISHLGAWLEQLLAESTGKQGKGFIPIDREPIGSPEAYGSDRVFVYLRVEASRNPELDSKVYNLKKTGHPFIQIDIFDLYNLGQEFFRWEMATSVIGAVLGINPFDQPDVEASKVATRQLTEAFERKGTLPKEVPIFEYGDIQLFDDPENAAELKKELGSEPTISDYLRAHINRAGAGDYFAILAYLPMNEREEELLQAIRKNIMNSKKVATCVEFGPRFLHSTGQAYKGGPNSGVFLQITGDDLTDLPVPGHKYSFGVVKAAEARGDFEVLTRRHRRAMRIHLRKDASAGLEVLRQEIERAVA
jgi:transaldolase/glucose-6-phosphate isomerase